MKYIAIKLKDFPYWIWFERKKVKEEAMQFIGNEGWGDGGANTSIVVHPDLIEGRMESEQLQYE